MLTLKPCSECGKNAQWVRRIQFSGDHFFCTKHALTEEEFGVDDSYQVWFEIIYTFIANKLSKPIIFLRGFGRSFNSVQFGDGFCQLKELEEAIEQAKDIWTERLHKTYRILQKYAIQEEGLSPEAAKFVINTEKYTDDVNMNVIDQKTHLEMICLEKEGHIISGEVSVSEDFIPLKEITFSFNRFETVH